MPLSELTPKQSSFVDEYLKDLNGSQAAIRAGYSEKGVNGAAARLLANVSIQGAIQERMARRAERTRVDADYVLNRMAEIDQMDAADLFNDDGSLKGIREWPKVWRQYISGMDVSEIFEGSGDDKRVIGVLRKVKWPDRLKNLELLGKHVDVQAWKERVEHDASDKLAEAIMNSRRRARNANDAG